MKQLCFSEDFQQMDGYAVYRFMQVEYEEKTFLCVQKKLVKSAEKNVSQEKNEKKKWCGLCHSIHLSKMTNKAQWSTNRYGHDRSLSWLWFEPLNFCVEEEQSKIGALENNVSFIRLSQVRQAPTGFYVVPSTQAIILFLFVVQIINSISKY